MDSDSLVSKQNLNVQVKLNKAGQDVGFRQSPSVAFFFFALRYLMIVHL